MTITFKYGLALAAGICMLVSCSKDDGPDNVQDPILGRWNLQEERVLEIEGTDTARGAFPGTAADYLVFSNDGKATFHADGRAPFSRTYRRVGEKVLELDSRPFDLSRLTASELIFVLKDSDVTIPGSYYEYTYQYSR